MIPGSASTHLVGAASGSSYQISRSLRFNSADSAYLSRTPASAGNRKTWTWAGWVKLSEVGLNTMSLFSVNNGTGGGNYGIIQLIPDGRVRFELFTSPDFYNIYSTPVYRDPGAWYHLVIVANTPDANAADRLIFYVNGVRQGTDTITIAQNWDTPYNTASLVHFLGNYFPGQRQFNGYLADIHFIDGQALAPTAFGQFDATTGEWVPIQYGGTYGTNGFRLTFADNSAATATTLGKDAAGSNNWTPYNFSVTNISAVTYITSGVEAASGGVVANGGTPYWVDVLPANADLSYNTTAANLHDGSLSTYVYWVGDEYVIGNIMQARLDLRDFGNTVGSVRVYVDGFGAGYFPYFARLLDASKVVISGTQVTFDQAGAKWVQIPVSGTPRYLEFYTTTGVSRRMYLYEIEVNGIRLTNSVGGTTDSVVDSPTSYGTDTGVGGEVRGNYCTLNPLDQFGTNTLSNGNLDVTLGTDGPYNLACGTVAITSGKWYWEVVAPTMTAGTMIGISRSTVPVSSRKYGDGNSRYYSQNGNKWSSASGVAYGASYTANDVVGVALDMDAGSLTYYKNGTSQGVAFTGLTGEWYPTVNNLGSGLTQAFVVNFGQRPFAYTAPSGFKALCDTSLPTPTIVKASTAFDVVTYTGTGASLTPTSSLGFSPDLVWIKGRSGATDHALYDTVRGATLDLVSNSTAAETTQAQGLTAFNSNGFTVGTLAKLNTNTATYAGWCWDAGSSTVTNTAGTIQSSVRANASAGFSVVTWNYNGTNATVGHGLGVAPGMIVAKRRDDVSNWFIYHSGIGPNAYMYLNSTAAQITNITGVFDGNSSTVFEVNNGLFPGATATYVAYCFAPVAGYSAFGSYTGNGSADGPFVYLGFRPAVVFCKRIEVSGNWTILDYKREGYNVDNDPLYPNLSSAEGTSDLIDITSNGFKVRTTDPDFNINAGTYAYAAWAANPFQYARAR